MEHHKSQSMQPSPAIEETGVLSSNGGPQGTLTDAEKRVFSDTPAVPSTECTSDAKVVPKQEVTDAAQPSSLIKVHPYDFLCLCNSTNFHCFIFRELC